MLQNIGKYDTENLENRHWDLIKEKESPLMDKNIQFSNSFVIARAEAISVLFRKFKSYHKVIIRSKRGTFN